MGHGIFQRILLEQTARITEELGTANDNPQKTIFMKRVNAASTCGLSSASGARARKQPARAQEGGQALSRAIASKHLSFSEFGTGGHHDRYRQATST